MNALSLDNYNTSELSFEQQIDTNGGEPVTLTGAAAVAALVGISLGALIVGAAVGYGIYKLIDWATS